MLLRLAPFLFVLLWSTGFIASKVAAEYAEPFTLLTIRFALVLVILVPWVVLTARPWPKSSVAWQTALSGFLIHTAYLGGVLCALREGMPAGIVAIVVSTQPILTALLAGPFLGEWPDRRHWLGLGIGIAGVVMVLLPRLGTASLEGGFGWVALFGALAALCGMTLGTLNQKKFGMGGDLIALTTVQYVAAFLSSLLLALATEQINVQWTLDFWLAMLWLVVVLSIGAIGLLLMMIRASAVSKVTSLFYLVPAVTALMAAMMFNETIGPLQFAGVALVMFAVFFIRNSGPREG